MQQSDDEQTNLANKDFWENGYENVRFTPMPRNDGIIKKIYTYFAEDASPEKEVFEIGCVPGRMLYYFGKMGYTISGLDQSEHLTQMVDWLQAEGFAIGSFKKEDLFKLTYNKQYDIVFSCGFIEHFTNFADVIQIHSGLVKPGGRIYITTPNFAGNIQRKLHETFDAENLAKHYLPSMNPEIWADVLRAEGMSIIEQGYTGGFDFWVGKQPRSIFQKTLIYFIKIMARLLRWLPNCRSYSPTIYIIAQKVI